MSLINEALKRARQAPVPPAPDLHFRPVEPVPTAQRKAGFLFPAVLGVFALLALVLVWHVVRPSHANPQPTAFAAAPEAKPAVAVEPPPVTPPAPSAPVAAATVASSPSSASAPAPTETRSPAPVTTAAPVPAPGNVAAAAVATNSGPVAEPPPPALPPLKLQGVVYNPRRPSAVISGKTLFIGDRVRDLRVVAIGQESVTLVGAGQTNVLSLAD